MDSEREPVTAALFVYHTWDKTQCGLTAFHCSLLEDFAHRQKGKIKVYATVLEATEEQKEEAEQAGITLIAPKPIETFFCSDEPNMKWLIGHETYFPEFQKLKGSVKYVVGYIPKTADAAYHIRDRTFTKASLIMINHAHGDLSCLPDSMALHKFEEMMLLAAEKADMLFSIGPSIHNYHDNQYRALDEEKKHKEIIPKLNPYFTQKDAKYKDSIRNRVLFSNRKIDSEKSIDGCERLVSAVGSVTNLHKESRLPVPQWRLFGATDQMHDKTKDFLSKKKELFHVEKVTVHKYTSNKDLQRYLLHCDLCFGTTGHQEYGFDGLEAIATGVPHLFEEGSQPAELIEKYFPRHKKTCIVEKSCENLKGKILEILSFPEDAYAAAKDLKKAYSASDEVKSSYAQFAAYFTDDSDQALESKCAGSNESGTVINPDSSENKHSVKKRKRSDSDTSDESSQKHKMGDSYIGHIEMPLDLKTLRVKIGLSSVSVYPERMPGDSTFDFREITEEFKALSNKAVQEHRDEIKRIVQEFSGYLEKCETGCICLHISFPFLSHLYQFETKVKSRRFDRTFEPMLITDKMKEKAAENDVYLQLQATYEDENFNEIETFFAKRDGGSAPPTQVNFGDSDDETSDEMSDETDDDDEVPRKYEDVEESKTVKDLQIETLQRQLDDKKTENATIKEDYNNVIKERDAVMKNYSAQLTTVMDLKDRLKEKDDRLKEKDELIEELRSNIADLQDERGILPAASVTKMKDNKPEMCQEKKSILICCKGWGSKTYATSTINQQIARQCIAQHYEVYITSVEEEEECNLNSNIQIIRPKKKRDSDSLDLEAINFTHETHFPALENIPNLSIIVGHIPETSTGAIEIQRNRCPSAKLCLFVQGISDNYDETEHFCKQAVKANNVFSNGDKIFHEFDNALQGYTESQDTCHKTYYHFPDEDFFALNEKREKNFTKHLKFVLTLYDPDRTGDIIEAMSKVANKSSDVHNTSKLTLVIGHHTSIAQEEKEKLRNKHCNSKWLKLQFCVLQSKEEIMRHFKRSQLFVIGNHHVPFGPLVMEAVAARLPVLISKHSGFNKFIEKHWPQQFLSMFVNIGVNDCKSREDIDLWVEHITAVFANYERHGECIDAKHLGSELQKLDPNQVNQEFSEFLVKYR